MPGLVQSHVHMCQTLARGRADDRELLPWLSEVVWPYEGALAAADVVAPPFEEDGVAWAVEALLNV